VLRPRMSSSRDHSVDRTPRPHNPVREQTESIHLEEDEVGADPVSLDSIDAESVDDSAPGEASVAHASSAPGDSLARGTGLPAEDRTKVATPAARNRTHPPSEPPRSSRSRKASAPPENVKESPDARLGEILGSYRVLDVLGKGGMGFVYRAEHVKLGREVALKVLRSDYAKRRDAVSRFFQEARTVNRIRHRNIVDVTDLLELDDGTTFIIMELLRGQSLGRWARKGFDLARALAVLIQICDGLAAAHAVGVIHRDLKPDNVFIVPTPDGAELVKLLDFGVAKLVNRDDEDVGLETAAGSVIGTPAYMSPEQAGGMPVDARADIYSVGAIMYEMFTGQPMFRGRSFGEYVRKHLSEHPVRPRATSGGAGMDERLEGAILRAIEKDPNRRFSSIAELRDVLLHLLGAIETRPPGNEVYSSHLLPPHALGGMPLVMPPAPTPLPRGPTGPSAPVPPMAVHSAPTVIGQHAAGAPDNAVYAGAGFAQGAAMQTGISSISQLHASGFHQTAPPPGSTPWWVWFAGGALAVGLGIGAAVWFVSRETEPQARKTAQELTPATPSLPDLPPPAPRVVQITFASSPVAGVFAAGSATEMCRTPCTIDVDLRDGGAEDHRDYVFRARGFDDKPVRVEITGDRITVPVVALAAEAGGPVGSTPDKADKGGGRKKDRDRDDKDRDDKKVAKPDDTATTKKPDDTKRDKIDRTDTIDPFAPPTPRSP
jgi:serine/threonine protein kinase